MDGTHQESPTGESFEDASQFKSGADAHVEALLAGDSVTITLVGSSVACCSTQIVLSCGG